MSVGGRGQGWCGPKLSLHPFLFLEAAGAIPSEVDMVLDCFVHALGGVNMLFRRLWCRLNLVRATLDWHCAVCVCHRLVSLTVPAEISSPIHSGRISRHTDVCLHTWGGSLKRSRRVETQMQEPCVILDTCARTHACTPKCR